MFTKTDLEEFVEEASWTSEDVQENPEQAADLIRELLRDRRILEECLDELNFGTVWTDLPDFMSDEEVTLEELSDAIATCRNRYEKGLPPRGAPLDEQSDN